MNSQKVFNFPTMTIALLATKSHSNFGHVCSQATAYISAPGDAELMEKMKQAIDNQRDSIRSKNADIDSLRKDLEAVRASGSTNNLSFSTKRSNAIGAIAFESHSKTALCTGS